MVEGGVAELGCTARGRPQPSLHWTRGDTELRVATGPVLQLHNTSRTQVVSSATLGCTVAHRRGSTPAGRTTGPATPPRPPSSWTFSVSSTLPTLNRKVRTQLICDDQIYRQLKL